MSDLSAVIDFIATYDGLDAGAPVQASNSGAEPPWYALVPAAGTDVLEVDIAGNKKRQFPFAFQSMRYMADEAERLESIGFYDGLTDWFEQQTDAGTLPELDEGKTADFIETTGRPFLLQTSPDIGIYTIPCRLVYYQDAP